MFRRRYAYADGTASTTTAGGAAGRFALARAIRMLAGLVALVIVAGILLVILNANMSNQVVSAVHDAAAWLAGPFKGLFHLSGHKGTVALNWGIAAVVYYAIGHFLARMLAR